MIEVPLALYVHLPWCVRKCPYCDFNSHGTGGDDIPETAYVDALLRDLELSAPGIAGRPIGTIFFGGGTPSLFSAAALDRFLSRLCALTSVAADAEITLEANPGTAEAARFRDYRALGINRLSIGVQSFSDRHLAALGRIHDAAQAEAALRMARAAGFDNFNIDIMYALPDQDVVQALADLRRAVTFEPSHLSWYQLTLEPGTAFHRRPPQLPPDDAAWDMSVAGAALLEAAGFQQYEVSAWSRPGRRCRHNLNYWEFGDYLGLGAGAHGKLSAKAGIRREMRVRQPGRYMETAGSATAIAERRELGDADLVFEFMLNAARLVDGFAPGLFAARTGLSARMLEPGLAEAERRGFLECSTARVQPTVLGRRFLNDLLELFLPAESACSAAV